MLRGLRDQKGILVKNLVGHSREKGTGPQKDGAELGEHGSAHGAGEPQAKALRWRRRVCSGSGVSSSWRKRAGRGDTGLGRRYHACLGRKARLLVSFNSCL